MSINFGQDPSHLPDFNARQKERFKRRHGEIGNAQQGKTKKTKHIIGSTHQKEFNVDINSDVRTKVFDALLQNVGPGHIASYFSDIRTLKDLFLHAQNVKAGEVIAESVQERVCDLFFEVCKSGNAYKADIIAKEFENFGIVDVNRFFNPEKYDKNEQNTIDDVTSILNASRNRTLIEEISNCTSIESLKTLFTYAVKNDMGDVVEHVKERVAFLFFEECKCRNTLGSAIIAKQFNDFDINIFEVTNYLNPQNYTQDELSAIEDVKTVFIAYVRNTVREVISECSNVETLKAFFSYASQFRNLDYIAEHIQKRVAKLFFNECELQNTFKAQHIAREFNDFYIDDIDRFKMQMDYKGKELQSIENTMQIVQSLEERRILETLGDENLGEVVAECRDMQKLRVIYSYAQNNGLQELAEIVKQKFAWIYFDVCKCRDTFNAIRIAKQFDNFGLSNVNDVLKFLNPDNYSPEELKSIEDVQRVHTAYLTSRVWAGHMNGIVSNCSDIDTLKAFFSFAIENKMHDLAARVQKQVANLFLQEFRNDNVYRAQAIAREFEIFGTDRVKEYILQNTNKHKDVEELLKTTYEDERKE